MTLPVATAHAVNTLVEYLLGLDPAHHGTPTATAAREAALELTARAHKTLAAGLSPAALAAAWPEGDDPGIRRGGQLDGHCPMGCGQTLRYRTNTGRVVCIAADCPRPLAVAELLADPETEHLLTVTDTGWTVKHPLRERLDDALMTCRAADVPRHHLLPTPAPDGPTVYRLVLDDGGVTFLAPLDTA